MHSIKLVCDKPFHNNCDVTVYDVTDGKEKKRCKIMVDYAESDIRQLQNRDTIMKLLQLIFKSGFIKP